ncbi:hypothetical protein, partial [Stenotrophomonas maltophilia]|uniref:hypothetical protein n=1 Tax=Stenotrophomonas maltophilia TaxID=40324 RepID=UPI001B3037CA
ERNLAKVEVASSSLVSRSNYRSTEFQGSLQVLEKRRFGVFFRFSDDCLNPPPQPRNSSAFSSAAIPRSCRGQLIPDTTSGFFSA